MTIGTYTAIADDITLDKPAKVLTRYNESGVPAAEVLIEDVITGSATLQVPATGAVAIAIGATFTLKDAAGTTFNLKISKVGNKFTNMGETKVNVEFRQRFATGT